jgi:hypothetical protein
MHNKIGVIILLLFGIVIGLTGIVCADPGVNATPETQTLSTVTTSDVVGLVMETDSGAWTISGGDHIYTSWGSYFDYPIAFNKSEDAQYTTAYDASIVAQAGQTKLTKTMNIDTRNKVTSQSNINSQTGLTFAATDDGGNVEGSENLMLDGVGDSTWAYDRMLCPFVSYDSGIPYFCNIIQAGSKYDLTIGSVATTANERFVGTDATDPVVLNYGINVKPYSTSQGQIPASGSAMAYLKVHLQEGRLWDYYHVNGGYAPLKAEDIIYSETSSTLGTISAFNKQLGYSSQVTSFAPVVG